ncbi:sulfotransferase family 2 domain-containing protein [Cribrihabitans sp. XS_ASV171]
MPIYKNGGRSVLFIHIPKTAGTAIDHAFLRAGWQVAFQDGGGKPDTILRHLRCSFQHFHAALLREMMVLASFDAIFTVMREPMARLQSEYRWRRAQAAQPLPPFDVWTNRMLDAYQGNSFVMDNHIRPQEQFILPQAQVTPLEKGLTHTMDQLSGKLGVEIPIHDGAQVNTSPDDQNLQLSEATRSRVTRFYGKDIALHRWLMEG